MIPTHLKSLQEETTTDPVLTPLLEHIIHGWQDCMQDLKDALQSYWCYRDELAILDATIMKGSHIVVTSILRTETLAHLHDDHQGLTATLQRARFTVYWPHLQDVSVMI